MKSDTLLSLKDDMVAFIAGHGMRRMNAFVTEEVPTVLFEEDDPDAWKDFVEHAKAAGSPFITMSEVVLEKIDLSLVLEQLREQVYPGSSMGGEIGGEMQDLEDAEALVKHVGKLGHLQLGFAHQGVMFVYEISTEWYERFQQLLDSLTDFGGMLVDGDDEED